MKLCGLQVVVVVVVALTHFSFGQSQNPKMGKKKKGVSDVNPLLN